MGAETIEDTEKALPLRVYLQWAIAITLATYMVLVISVYYSQWAFVLVISISDSLYTLQIAITNH